MKKLFFIAAIASVAFAGCTKNDPAPSVTQQDEITFLAPVVGTQTKVYGAIGSAYDPAESFDVWCVHNTAAITGWGGTAYFSDVPAIYDGTLGGWALSPKYYWPATGMLSFVALSPSITTDTDYSDDTGFKITGWSQGADQDAIVDLMYSDEVLNKAKGEYKADGEEVTGDANSHKGVDITFNHALSYLVFKVKTLADYSGSTEFCLNAITLSGVYTTGDFQQMTDASTPNTDPWTEKTDGATGTYTAYSGTLSFDSSPVDVPETTNKEIILLPQALTAAKQKIKVDYQISTDGGAHWIDQTQTVDITNTGVSAWEMGKKYTYTLSIGMTEIIFDPAVANWTPADAAVEF